MQMEINVASVTLFCHYAEIAYSKSSGYELHAFTSWQVFLGHPIKKKMLYENIPQSIC